jgi:hypothetical protein
MAALSAGRVTGWKAVPCQRVSYKVKGSTTIYQGSLVVLDSGYACPGRTATGLIAVGRACFTVTNSGSSGDDVTVDIETGTFKWINASGDPLLAANVGGTAYITDDQTVNVTSTGKSAAGKLIELESDGAWISTLPL